MRRSALTALLFVGLAGCKPSDPGELLLYHLEKVVGIMEDNMSDCTVAADKIVAYWQANQDDLRSIGSRQTEMVRTLSQSEKLAYAKSFREKYERMVRETSGTAREFERRCGHLAGRYRQVMQSLRLGR